MQIKFWEGIFFIDPGFHQMAQKFFGLNEEENRILEGGDG